MGAGGGNLNNSRSNSGESEIKVNNANKLTQKWAYNTNGDVSATPTVVDGVVYAVDWGGWIHAVNAKTGVAIWSKKLSDYTNFPGTLSRTSPAIVGNLVIIGDQGDLDSAFGFPAFSGNTASIMAIDKTSGNLVWRTKVSTHPFSIVTSSPVAYDGRVYVGVASLEENAGFIPGWTFFFRGSVVALNTATGAILWETSSVPPGYTGGAVWGNTPVVDPKRGSLYVATGNNYTIPANVAAQIAADPANGGNYLDPSDYIDAIISMDLVTGAIKWGKRLQGADTWNLLYGFNPDPAVSPDWDFGSGPNLYTVNKNNKTVDLLGAGQKSGKYWALNPDNGTVVWSTQVGPGGLAGGIQWGSATDGNRIYVAVSNSDSKPYTVLGGGATKSAGLWAGLDAATGTYLWQTPDPANGKDFGMVTIANGVMFAGSTSGHMYAINGATGAILWSYDSGASTICGPSVVKGSVYWGTGYGRFGGAFGTGGVHKLFAFGLE